MLMRTVLALAAAIVVVAHTAEAQEPHYFKPADPRLTSIFRADPGVLVEGAGFKRMTLAMVQDSLDKAELKLFADERTWGTLRRLPFFPQSVILQNRADSAVTVFLAVVEPSRSNMLTVRKIAGDTLKSVAPWPALVKLGHAPFNVLRTAVLTSINARATGLRPQLSQTMRADSAELTSAWQTLEAHRTSADANKARQILTTSAHVDDRIAAIAILSNFDKEDAAWHALVGALLDPSELVREHARSVLRAFSSAFTRRVDWRPAAKELHAVLQGSDLFFLSEAMDMLVATGAGPDVAAPLLKDGGNGVLMFAGAQNAWARAPAHRFLRAVSDRDAATPTEWQKWIASL